jgi:hypothetical protein
VRNRVWNYAVGEHQIDIQDPVREEPTDSVYELRALSMDSLLPSGFARPSFQLAKVCRQMYMEISPLIYTLNTFSLHNLETFDRWIKLRTLGQRRLIASIDVPRTYMRLYRSGFRRNFRQKFPNITRIGFDNWTLYCDFDQDRLSSQNKSKKVVDQWKGARTKIISEIRDKEGEDLVIDWHGSSSYALF